MAVNVTHLRSFLAVARARGFSAAARQLRVAQPALTKQIKELEARYGIALFEREASGVRLTEDGAVLLDHAARVFNELSQVEFLLKTLGRRALRIGSVSTRSLSRLLTTLHGAIPDLETSIQIAPSMQVLDGLKTLRFDLGVLTIDREHEDLQAVEIERAPYLVLLPSGHPLARPGATSVPIAALAGRSLLIKPPTTRSRQVLDGILASLSVQPGSIRDVDSPEMIAELVACGLGIGVIARSTETSRPDVVALPFRECIAIPVHAVTQVSARQTRNAQRAWGLLRAHLAAEADAPALRRPARREAG